VSRELERFLEEGVKWAAGTNRNSITRVLKRIKITLTLARCLHVNYEDASFPQHRPKFDIGLNQVIADYYDIELIEFGDPAHYLPMPEAPDHHAGQDPSPKDPRARGLRGNQRFFLYDSRLGTLYHVEPGFDVDSPPWPFDFQGTDDNNRSRVEPMYVSLNALVPSKNLLLTLNFSRPWHPDGGAIANVHAYGLPVQLVAADRIWQSSGVNQASQAKIECVLAGKDHPTLMPNLPVEATVLGWTRRIPLAGALDLNLGMSTVRAAEGPPPLGKYYI
jgi:hypothetical protein